LLANSRGQHHQVEAGGGKGQRGVVGFDLHPAAAGREAEGHAVGAQEIELRRAELHRVVAEDVGHQRIEAGRLPGRHVAPQRRVEPGVQAGEGFRLGHRQGRRANGCLAGRMALQFRMQIIPLPAFRDNYIWLLRAGPHAVVVDPGDAAPVLRYLADEG
jgi:hypothetical protein